MKHSTEENSLLKDLYVRQRAVYKKMTAAKGIAQTVYIYGASGYGKTTFLEHYLQERKYYYFSAGNIRAEDLDIEKKGRVTPVVIDDIQMAPQEEIREAVESLDTRTDIWLILSGRCPVPSWLGAAYIKSQFMVIEERDLAFTKSELSEFLAGWNLAPDEDTLEKILSVTEGNAFAARLTAMEIARGIPYEGEHIEQMKQIFYNYLDYHVYDQWDVELQEFLMQISIVEKFDIHLAEMITGRKDVEGLIKMARETGNFLVENNGVYEFRGAMCLSMRRRLSERYTKEERNNLYYNAGLYYEIADMIPEALVMYEACGNKNRISGLLIANARRNPASGYYFELRDYYLSLPDETKMESVELMAGMSMLHSILLNPQESERWYEYLKGYEESHTGIYKKTAKSWLVYLDIALPHRGAMNLVDILKNTGTLLFNRSISLPEFSVTSNLPSMMNGGKDFCEWSKRDTELAKSIGKVVEFVLGKYGKGLVNLALAESYFEKGEDNYLVSALANRGMMQAEAGGKLEQCFVAVGILVKLHLFNNHLDEAEELLSNFCKKAVKEGGDKLMPNIRAMQCRIALYEDNREEINRWMEEAPKEEQDFCSFDRYRYLTKVRVYLLYGKYGSALNLLQKLLYYSEMMYRTFVRMEAKLLLAVVYYRMGNSAWAQSFKEMIKEAGEYHFVRLISREGAAVLELLKDKRWANTVNREFYQQVMKETESMALAYPSYLRARPQGDVVLSENALKVLRLQAEGLSNLEISAMLGIKENTVKYHSKQTYKKLGVNSKTAAVTEARRRKLI